MRIAIASALLPALLAGCEAGLEPEAIAASAPAGLTARESRRCEYCGWIESKREMISPGPQALGAYEYTVRMADGSTRVFEETLPVSWRVRERLLVIDGARPLDRAPAIRAPGS